MGVLDFISKPKQLDVLLKSAMARFQLKYKSEKPVQNTVAKDEIQVLKK